MTFDGTCERGGFQRAPQETEKIPPAAAATATATTKTKTCQDPMAVVRSGVITIQTTNSKQQTANSKQVKQAAC
jgi:hypothetical protein